LSRYLKHLKFVALLLLAVAIIWWLGRRLDWVQVKAAMATSDWRLIALGAAIILLAYLWRAIRWQVFLAPLTETSLREVWVATTVGFGAVLLIGRMGEVVRPVVLPMRDPRVRPAASFVTILIERLYDTITVVSIFAINLLWLKTAIGSPEELSRARAGGFLLVGLLGLGILVLIWFNRRAKLVIGWLDRRIAGQTEVASRLKRVVLSTLEQLATALSVLSDVRRLAVSIGWSILLWGTIALGNLLVCRAFGLPFGVTQILFVLGWSMLGSIVPTPGGGAGAFHAATGAALVLLGAAREQAAAVSITLHLVDFAPAALFGLFYVLRGDINLARLRSLVSTEAVEHAVEDERVVLVEGG
jgi:glycosyltransferase 2 family protein